MISFRIEIGGKMNCAKTSFERSAGLLLLLTFLLPVFSTVFGVESSLAYYGTDGRLVYGLYANQNETDAINRLPDFSFCGYQGGGVAIPDVPTVLTVCPQEGDDTQLIQSAIDNVSARSADANGFRGAVLLKAGRYQVQSTLRIRVSGVILRGEGQDVLGTVLEAVTPSDYDVISLGSGSDSYGAQSGTIRAITSSYVPSGAVSFEISDTSGYDVGDWISVQRTPNQFWIDDLAMGQWGWTPAGYVTDHERRVTAITGNTLTVDVPLVDVYQDKYGRGRVFKLNPISRIRNCGIENVRLESCYSGNTDEQHPWDAIRVQYAENSWIRGVTAQYFAYSCVNLGSYARYITVEDCAFIDPKSIITGGRRYSFNIDGTATRNLFQRCYSHESRHDFVLGSKTRGPNAFVDCYADRSHADSGPHHRWSTGTLLDNVYSSNSIDVENRESSGSGHGWSGAQMVFWNCQTPNMRSDAPKGAMNFAIGAKAAKREGNWAPEEPFGWWEHQNLDVSPRSLYFQQLRDRLGQAAVERVTTASQRAGNIWSDLLAWGGKTRFQPDPLRDTPRDQQLKVGSPVIFEVFAQTEVAVSRYEWYELTDAGYIHVGENSPLLILPNGQPADLGRTFFCRVLTGMGPHWSPTASIVSTLAGTNAALSKPTLASSFYSSSYTAEKAVDGNPSTFWNSAASDDYPWWQVNLGENCTISHVNFVNRATSTSTLLARLSDLQIQVLDGSQAVLFTSPLINPQNQAPTGSNEILTYFLPSPVTGRYVKITKMTGPGQSWSDAQTNIAEIQVFTGAAIPSTPAHVTATAGDGTILLDWNDNAESDFSQYVVYRSTLPGAGYLRIAEGLTDSHYVDVDGLDLQTRYYYVVRAENRSGNLSGFSNEVSCIPQITPTVPTGLHASGSDGFVRLLWDGNTQPDFSHFTLFRSRNCIAGFVSIASNLTLCEYIDDTVEDSKTYYYVITETNLDGIESAFSAPVDVVPKIQTNLAINQPTTASSYYGSAVPEYAVDGLTSDYPYIWHSAQDGSDPQPWIRVDLPDTIRVDKIRIHNRANAGTYSRNRDFDLDILNSEGLLAWSNYDEATGEGSLINEDNWMNSPAVIDYIVPVTAGGRAIVLTKRSGLAGASATANIAELEVFRRHEPPAPVTGLAVMPWNGGVLVNWTGSVSAGESYRVYRRLTGDDYIQIAAVSSANQYADTAAPRGNRIGYTVTAVDTEGVESGYSAEASITLQLTADLDSSGAVDSRDFVLFSRLWLLDGSGVSTADIAPDGGDQMVDIMDLVILADQWLNGK